MIRSVPRLRRRFSRTALGCLLVAIVFITLHIVSRRWEILLCVPLERMSDAKRVATTTAATKPYPFMTGATFARGSVFFVWGFVPPPNHGSAGVIVGPPALYSLGWNGFLYHKGQWGDFCFAVPIWPLAVPVVIAAGLLQYRHRRRHRWESEGLCRQCGYDLRATPERCPECGTVTADSASLQTLGS
jgi:hypothetical protein